MRSHARRFRRSSTPSPLYAVARLATGVVALGLGGLLVAACDATTPLPVPGPDDAAVDASSPQDMAPPPRPGLLGLNDVTILLPLADPGAPTLLRATDKGSDGSELVPRALYDRLNRVPKRGPVVFLDDLYPLLQVIAVRFDLCDRIKPGPCPDEDGRMRVVLQSQYPAQAIGNVDVGLHAFYTIPKSDFPALASELRALSVIQAAPLAAPLGPSPALMKSINSEYATRLKALVVKYAVAASLTRLTFLAARDDVRSVSWTFRGLERAGADLLDIQIPGIGTTLQDATLGGQTVSFTVVPTADAPSGFTLASDEVAFAAAAPPAQAAAIAALNAIDNPDLHTANTIACVTCHISGRLVGPREQVGNTSARALPNRFASGTFDLTVPRALKSSLRNLGWSNRAALVSQRVANDSAQVASEFNARFPP